MPDKPGKRFGDEPSFWRRLRAAPKMLRLHLVKGRQYIDLDYRVRPRVRYGHGEPPNPHLQALLERGRGGYRDLLGRLMQFREQFGAIPYETDDPAEPCWANTYIPPLDGMSIYGLLALNRPARLLEIGSGNSTKFARRAVADHDLPTRITSIDPLPRAECDALCDRVVRSRLEDADLTIFDELAVGDVLYMDGSHRCFQNSDVTVFFLDVLPRVADGVVVAMHDIFLPWDYPPRWLKRFYSEQYVLAAHLLGAGERFEVVLPNYFVSQDEELSAMVSPLSQLPALGGREIEGWLLWFRQG